jgi:hypothetical protein
MRRVADYSKWPERRLNVSSLLLDARNPRIPPGTDEPSQRQLIEELIEHDNVYELAREMATSGFDPLELLVGIDDDGRTIILEGNRRLAALKVLEKPDLAPERFVKRLKQLAQSDGIPGRVRVLVAPSRDDAAPLILRKHTREQIQRWSPLMQARFYQSLTESGITIKEMAKRYGVAPGEIASFLRLDSMYRLARSMDLPADIARAVNDPREFPASVLERLIDTRDFRTFLGVDFDAEGGVTAKVNAKDFRKAYSRVLSDIAAKRIDTRTVNKAQDTSTYIEKHWAGLKPKPQQKTLSLDELAGKAAASATATEQPSKASAAATRATTGRPIPPGLRCTISDDRVREIFKELKSLTPKRYANAHAVLLRILLELAVNHYVTETGGMKPLLEKAAKEKKGADWSPSLRQMLRPLLEDANFKARPLARKAVNRLLNDDGKSTLSVETLDGFVHNNFEWPDERQIQRMWNALKDVLVIVLSEPTSAPPVPPSKK